MTTAAIIVAAGRGTRAGGGVPKQWRTLAGRSVAERSVAAFRDAGIERLVLVVHPDDMDRAIPGVLAVPGGATRCASVRAGLEALADQGVERVLIHDAARPLVSRRVIEAVLETLVCHDGAAPALPVTDALWRGDQGLVSGTVDREGLYRAQTPQGFRFEAILAAHRAHAGDAPDDVAVARAAGMDVAIVPGDERNIKLTTVEDISRAERLLEADVDVRLGNGFDVHRFAPGDRVTLCGVEITHDHGLEGHSDADVAMHAVTDAVYGALAAGDIGRHFPPSDPQWKGEASRVFLEHAVGLARERGFAVSNADVTIVCERPKIGPHAAAMKSKMADIMGVDPERVSVKATTSEKLGFTGRGEGIATLATATLVRR